MWVLAHALTSRTRVFCNDCLPYILNLLEKCNYDYTKQELFRHFETIMFCTTTEEQL